MNSSGTHKASFGLGWNFHLPYSTQPFVGGQFWLGNAGIWVMLLLSLLLLLRDGIVATDAHSSNMVSMLIFVAVLVVVVSCCGGILENNNASSVRRSSLHIQCILYMRHNLSATHFLDTQVSLAPTHVCL